MFRFNVRFVISKGQFNKKVNFDTDLPEAEYWMNIFSNLDLNLKILLLSYLHLLSSNCLVCEYSCKFNEALVLGPIFLKIDFRYKILKYQCHTRAQRL